MDKIKYTLIIIALCLATSGAALTSGLLTMKKTVTGAGTVSTITGGGGGGGGSSGGTNSTISIDLYSNSACTTPLTSISWGSLSPGGTTTQTIYIKNSGTVPVTLSLVSDGWTPSQAATYLSVTWDKGGSSLAVGQNVAAKVTLTITSNITGITNFSCNINVLASG
jgi:hypothetical protein